jgi:transposase
LVLQFAEGLSDRQAADTVRSRIDWKYALSLELTDTGLTPRCWVSSGPDWPPTTSQNGCCNKCLTALGKRGLLVGGGRQRTDATHVLASVREFNRLELVTETLRAALEALAAAAPTWRQGVAPDQWYERYGQRARDWRLPKAETARAVLAVTVGSDGSALLEVVYAADTPGWLRQIPAVGDSTGGLGPAVRPRPAGLALARQDGAATRRAGDWQPL